MTPSRESFAVAGGTGLPVPLVARPHRTRDWSSTAPPFLQRSVAELAALDAAPDPKREPKRVTVAREARQRRGTRGPEPVELPMDEIRAAYEGGQVSTISLARQYGISTATLYRHMQNAGIPLRQARQPARLDMDDIERQFRDGMSLRRIAAQYKTDKGRLAHLLRERGIEVPHGGNRRAA